MKNRITAAVAVLVAAVALVVGTYREPNPVGHGTHVRVAVAATQTPFAFFLPTAGPVAATAAPGPAQFGTNNFADVSGNVWSISASNGLVASGSAGSYSGLLDDVGTGSSAVSSTVSVEFVFSSTVNLGLVARNTSTSVGAANISCSINNSRIQIFDTAGTVGGTVSDTSLTNGTTYVAKLDVVQGNATTTYLGCYIYAPAGSTALLSDTPNDTTTAIQNVSGTNGIGIYSPTTSNGILAIQAWNPNVSAPQGTTFTNGGAPAATATPTASPTPTAIPTYSGATPTPLATMIPPTAAPSPGATQGANGVIGWTTSADLTSFVAPIAASAFTVGTAGGATPVPIVHTTTYQTIDGWGGNFTDATASVLWNAPPSIRQSVMQDLFAPGVGLNVSMVRVTMGGCDNCVSHYSYDDLAATPGTGEVADANHVDPNLNYFSIAHDDAYMVPLLQQALQYQPSLKVMLTPWSPPAWMKTPITIFGDTLGTNSSTNPAYYSALAQYFVKTIQAYEARGIPVWMISPQNEPESNQTSFDADVYTEAQEATFVGSYLGPALSAASSALHPSGMLAAGVTNAATGKVYPAVKICGYDHNWNDTSFPDSLLADATAGPYLAGTCEHGYSGAPSAQSTVHTAAPTKPIWDTEYASTTTNSSASYFDSWLPVYVIGNLQNWGASYLWWTMVQHPDGTPYAVYTGSGASGGCSACLGIDDIDTSGNVTRTAQYAMLAAMSKIVDVGATRIAAATNASGVQTVAFANPNGTRAIILLNSGSSAQAVAVQDDSGYTFSVSVGAGAIDSLRYGLTSSLSTSTTPTTTIIQPSGSKLFHH